MTTITHSNASRHPEVTAALREYAAAMRRREYAAAADLAEALAARVPDEPRNPAAYHKQIKALAHDARSMVRL